MAFLRSFALLFLMWPCLVYAQQRFEGYKISGRVVDAETLEPMPFANVFIDQTTLGTATDINGEYVIEHLENGEYKLVFSFVGYELYTKTVTINGSDLRLSVRMVPSLEMLQSVEVKGSKDKEWEAQLRQFNKVFFGETQWAKDCKILNPWVLEFTQNKSTKEFTATASEPIEIENAALGYHVRCNLQLFSATKKSYKIQGLYKFEEVNTLDAREATRWTRNRRLAYQMSLRFLMKSIVDEHEKENGFNLYLDNRPATYSSQTGYFAHELERNLQVLNTKNLISPYGRPGLYKLQLDKRVEVHHTTQFARNKTYRDVSHPVSWIEVEKGQLIVSAEGHIVNSNQIITSGEFNNFRIAGMLPLNYSPGSFVVVNYLTKRNTLKRLQERVFLQTDKSVYYPGERIWFKAHMNYANPAVRDSLSRVLYVDLIKGDSILKNSLVHLDSLGGNGVVELNEQWPPGEYQLRAYTRWMQNYGNTVISCVPIRLLATNVAIKPKIKSVLAKGNDFVFTPTNIVGDSVAFQVELDSTIYHEWATCSIVATPLSVSSAADEVFKEALTFQEDLPEGTLGDFVFPIEYSFEIRGRVNHPKKSSFQSNLSVIEGKLDSVYYFKTDKKGYFKLNHLTHYDTMSFSFQARDKRGRILGTTYLLPPTPVSITKKATGKIQQYDSIQLQEVLKLVKPKRDTVVKKTPLITAQTDEEKTGLLTADYVLTRKILDNMPGGQNILMAIQGRIPGFNYNSSSRTYSLRGAKTGGSTNSDEPLFLLDGIPIFSGKANSQPRQTSQTQTQAQTEQVASDNTQGTRETYSMARPGNQMNNDAQYTRTQDVSSVSDMLSHVTVASVSRVEVSTRMDPRYGSMGANGVIAIYTRKVQGKGSTVRTMDVFTIKGFEHPRAFEPGINYSGNGYQDYSPTCYWNPTAVVSALRPLKVAFQTLKANEMYRVVVTGVTKSGIPLYGEFLIESGLGKPVRASLDVQQK